MKAKEDLILHFLLPLSFITSIGCLFVGINEGEKNMKREALEQGHMYYDPLNGQLKWKETLDTNDSPPQ